LHKGISGNILDSLLTYPIGSSFAGMY
jgi:hypothetical protein